MPCVTLTEFTEFSWLQMKKRVEVSTSIRT